MNKRVRMLYLAVLQEISRFFNKDSMKYKLERYRLNGAKIGENVRAFSPISSPEAYLIIIGNNVTISTGVKFCTHDNSAIKLYEDGTDFVGSIEIGDNSFIGMNTILLGGIKLPKNCIVGAGSVVTKSYTTEGIVLAGNPARPIGTIENIRSRKENNFFNFRGMSADQKRNMILAHKDKWVKRGEQ